MYVYWNDTCWKRGKVVKHRSVIAVDTHQYLMGGVPGDVEGDTGALATTAAGILLPFGDWFLGRFFMHCCCNAS